MPGSIFWVAALNALQNSMMLRPRCPRAGPIGGDGFALPAGTCSLMYPTIFFAMVLPSLLGDARSRPWLASRDDAAYHPAHAGVDPHSFSTCEYSNSTGVARPK